MYSKIGINSRKATIERAMRIQPFVRVRAKLIMSEAIAIKPIAMKEAHILSIELTFIQLPSEAVLCTDE